MKGETLSNRARTGRQARALAGPKSRQHPVSAHDAAFADLLLHCQNTAYAIVEDMRVLWQHKTVREALDPLGQFLELVNRKELENGPSSSDFHISRGLEELITDAELFLHRKGDWDLPPPFWLRALTSCFRIVREKTLFPQGSGPVLRWLAFNIAVRDYRSEQRIAKSVNLNSGGHDVVLKGQAKPLTDVLFDYVTEVPDTLLWSWWAIRFRTAGPKAGSAAPWLDIHVAANNRRPITNTTPPPPLTSVTPPGLYSERERRRVMQMFRQWAGFGKEEDIPGKSTERIRDYCLTLKPFYESRQWPVGGVDALLCPGIVCSPEPAFAATAATIFWGFEGTLSERQARVLLMLSQALLSGIAQFPRMVEIQTNSKESELHELPKEVAALEMKLIDLRLKLDELRKDVPTVPTFTMPDEISVLSMFTRARTKRELLQLPSDCAESLEHDWTVRSISRFVGRVVWLTTLAAMSSDRTVQEHRSSGVLKWKDVRDLEKQFPRPRLLIPERFRLREAHFIYPLALLALRRAFRESFRETLLNPEHLRGEVLVQYQRADDGSEEIQIRHSGIEPSEQMNFPDDELVTLRVFQGLTGPWRAKLGADPSLSVYDHESGNWIITLTTRKEDHL